MSINCCKCNKLLNKDTVIETDEFREHGSEIKNYCPSCFIEAVQNGFGHYEIGNCSICNSPMVLEHSEEETVSLAQIDYTVHFTCKKVKDAHDKIDRLEEENHDWIGYYTIQPE